MFSNDTIFGTPDYLEKVNEEDFTLNIENVSSNNISEIIGILEKTDVYELDNIQTKYKLDDGIIYEYKLKKDRVLLEYIKEKNYKEIYKRLEDLEVIPKRNLYKNAYSKILKIQAGDEEPTPQSAVYVFPVAGVFVFVGAVYAVLVHSAGAAVNVGAGANLWVEVSIKFNIYGYSIESKLLTLIKELFPKFSFSNVDLDKYMNKKEQENLFKFIIYESSEKMKNELISQKYEYNLPYKNCLDLIN